jgi:hypothetical protein
MLLMSQRYVPTAAVSGTDRTLERDESGKNRKGIPKGVLI